MEHTKGTMIVSAVLLVVCLAIASFLILIYDNTWSLVIFLGSAFIFRILIDYFAPKQKRSDNDGND